MSDDLVERVALKIAIRQDCNDGRRCMASHCGCRIDAHAAVRMALEEAAKVAEGPVYKTSGTTGEVSLRGSDGGNWSVPMPLSGFKGSDYGTGRYDAAAAIRGMMEKRNENV
jgi:hypothetical protein